MNIHISEMEGKPAVCFDTGLDPRSFARTKMSQSLVEPGYIVYPDGSHIEWRSSGVDDVKGFMRVWGSNFNGERLDTILNKIDAVQQETSLIAALQLKDKPRQEALKAVAFWIRAKLMLGDVKSTLHPGAAFFNNAGGEGSQHPKGSIFFTPKNLAQRCLIVEGEEINRYSCPDLYGMEESAFCAGAMLYKILSKSYPYPDDNVIYQDMREGVFLPVHLAAPGLDEKLCALIQAALMLPVANRKTFESGTDILSGLLKILVEKQSGKEPFTALFANLPDEEGEKLYKERKFFLFKQKVIVNTRRFAARNKPALLGVAAGLLFVIFVVSSMTKTRNERLTTAGMASDTVIYAYYDAFSTLNHTFMEECIYGADKSDVNVAATYYAVTRARQAYENNPRSAIFSAKMWRDNGGELPAPDVFGVTDITIKRVDGDEEENFIVYSVNYLLWFPNEELPSSRTDILTLKRIKKNWRITEINRTIN